MSVVRAGDHLARVSAGGASGGSGAEGALGGYIVVTTSSGDKYCITQSNLDQHGQRLEEGRVAAGGDDDEVETVEIAGISFLFSLGPKLMGALVGALTLLVVSATILVGWMARSMDLEIVMQYAGLVSFIGAIVLMIAACCFSRDFRTGMGSGVV